MAIKALKHSAINRTFTVALLPDRSDCKIALLWHVVTAERKREIVSAYTKQVKETGAAGSVEWVEKTDFAKVAEVITSESIKGWSGVSARSLDGAGIVPFGEAGIAADEAENQATGGQWPFTLEAAQELIRESPKFRDRIIALSDLEAVQAAREAAEKNGLSATPATGGGGA